MVLIESDWNLKLYRTVDGYYISGVLIESDWNLKYPVLVIRGDRIRVLIESDWNLKQVVVAPRKYKGTGINRIRLEFKDTLKAMNPALANTY